LALQSKPKPARFIDGVHSLPLVLEFGRPAQKRFLPKALWRLGITPAHLLHHHVKILVHINPKLDHFLAAIKLAAGSLM
jgi:hypothetical protein